MLRASSAGGELAPEKPVRLWSCTWTGADQETPPLVDREYHIRSSVQLVPKASESQTMCTVPFFWTASSRPRSMPPTRAVGMSGSVQVAPVVEENAIFALLSRSQQV